MPRFEIIEADYERYKKSVSPEVLSFPGSIFYHPDFLLAASVHLGLQFRPLLCYRSGSLCGIANLLSRKRGRINSASIPQLFQYYGLKTLGDQPDLFEELERTLVDNYDLAVLSLTADESQKYNYKGWRQRKRLTYLLQPGSFEKMKKRCFPDVKNKVNKALKAGISIAGPVDFPYELYSITFRRRGKKPPVARSRLIGWVNELSKLKLAETYIALMGEKSVAFRTELTWAGTAGDWLAGADPQFLNTGANQLLMLKMGEILAGKGITDWDLLGGDLPGIGKFKRSFGSEPVAHLQIEKNFTNKGKLYRGLMKLRSKIDGRN